MVVSAVISKKTYDYTASMGIYMFVPQAMKFIAENVYLDFPELVLKMIAAGERLTVMPLMVDGFGPP